MNAYTISKLAEDAGVSTDIVRNYQIRGMLQPCKCADCGYGIYDESALSRLRFIRAGKGAGVGLNELATLCKALDEQDEKRSLRQIAMIEAMLESRQQELNAFKSQLKEVQL